MRKFRLSVLIPLLLVAFIPAMYAFESTMSVEGGINLPQDDVEGDNVLMGSWAVTYDAWVFGDLGLRIGPWFTNVKIKNDANDYHSSLEGVNLYLKYKPTKVLAENFPRHYLINRFSPFIAVGAGWSTHYSENEHGIIDDASPDKIGGHLTFPYASAGFSILSKWNTTMDIGVKFNMFDTDMIDLVQGGDYNDALLTPYLAFGMHFGRKEPLIDPEILKLRNDLNSTNLKLNEVIGQLNAVTTQMPEFQTEIQNLQESMDQAENYIATLQTEYAQMDNKLNELTNKVTNLEQRVAQTPAQITQITTPTTPSADIYANDIRQLQDTQASLTASLNQINQDLAVMNQKIGQLDALTAQVNAIKGAADVSAYAKELAELRTKINNYEVELATIREDTVNLHKTDNELTTSINDLRSRINLERRNKKT